MAASFASLIGAASKEETDQKLALLEARLDKVERILATIVGSEDDDDIVPVAAHEESTGKNPRDRKAFAVGHDALPAELRQSRSECQKKDAEITELRQQKKELQRQLSEANKRIREAERLQQQMAARGQTEHFYSDLGLNRDNLEKMLETFATMPVPFRDSVAVYYDLHNLPTFFSQCGQVSRLRQCWVACRDLVLKNLEPGNTGEALAILMQIYNHASPDNMCELISATVGEGYDFTTEDRVGAQGTKIANVLFPGLRLPNGSIVSKCLVVLG